jgi:Ras-related GTP-binding protein C/D
MKKNEGPFSNILGNLKWSDRHRWDSAIDDQRQNDGPAARRDIVQSVRIIQVTMSNYYSSNQYYDDDDGESISSGSNNGGMMDGLGSPYQSGAGLPNTNMSGMMGATADTMNGAGMDAPILLNSSFIGTAGGQENNIVDFDDPRIASLPRILLMGPRRAGKTSIQRVVFHKMSPHETLFRLEATQMLERAVVDHTPLCRFTIWDFPGDQYEYGYDVDGAGGGAGEDNGGVDGDGYNDDNEQQPQQQQQQQHNYDDQIFSKATALIFVLDAQDEPYDHVLQSFTDTVTRAVRANPTIAVEVFVHKVDGELFLSDEAKYDCRRDVMQQVADELADAGLSHDAIPISYHLTSIYDHSVFEAFSRVVQRLIPELPTLEHLLNVLVSTCSMEKAYLFDVASKLYISTDSSPVDMQSVELCSDMIDVVLDVSGIYGMGAVSGTKNNSKKQSQVSSLKNGGENGEEVFAESLDVGMLANELDDNDGADELESPSLGDGAGEDELLGKLIGQTPPSEEVEDEGATDADAGSAYDSESSSTIHLSNGMVLYLKEVDTMLALVCLTRTENFKKKSLINYNIGCLKKALRALPQSQGVSTSGI